LRVERLAEDFLQFVDFSNELNLSNETGNGVGHVLLKMTDSPSLGKAFEKSRRINRAAGSRADVGAALRRDGLPQTAPTKTR